MPTKIEWAQEAWNPITGCSPVSAGCANCYAKRMATRLAGRCGYPANEPFRVTFHPDRLDEPLGWKKPRRIFVCSMGDLFHEKVSNNEITEVIYTLSEKAPLHTYMILTKRPHRMAEYFSNWKTIPNLWLGVTAENQEQADKRIPILLSLHAAVRFVSDEPSGSGVFIEDGEVRGETVEADANV